MQGGRRSGTITFALLLGLGFSAPGAWAQWVIEGKDGASSIKIGFLAQPAAEWLETADGHVARNYFVRRFRILFSGKVAEKWEFFFETDSPNIGKANPDPSANPTGAKDLGTIYIQDVFLTYTPAGPAFKVDVGLMLPMQSRNHGQSAATLLPVDYGAFTFADSGPTGERVGRDYGIQLRGYPLDQHLEYRVALFSGVRGVEATNAPRLSTRLVWYPWAAEHGFFYTGTFQGTKKLLAVGGSFDAQEDYRSYGGDVFFEQPLAGNGLGLTAQAGWTRYDGGSFLATVPKQDTFLAEAGLHLARGRLTPFVQYAVRDHESPELADQTTLQLGLAWWMKGHTRNLKLSAGRLHVDGQPDRTQVLTQLQVFYN